MESEEKKERSGPASQPDDDCVNVGKLLLFPKKQKKTKWKKSGESSAMSPTFVRLCIRIELYIISRAFKLRSGLAILRSRISIRKLFFVWNKKNI